MPTTLTKAEQIRRGIRKFERGRFNDLQFLTSYSYKKHLKNFIKYKTERNAALLERKEARSKGSGKLWAIAFPNPEIDTAYKITEGEIIREWEESGKRESKEWFYRVYNAIVPQLKEEIQKYVGKTDEVSVAVLEWLQEKLTKIEDVKNSL